MTVNPYEFLAPMSSPSPRRLGVGRYILACELAVLVGTIVAAPGVAMINEIWQVVPTNGFLADIRINDHPISNGAAIASSIGAGAFMMLVGLMSAVIAFRNWRTNRRVAPELWNVRPWDS
ncbi:MAG: hypothetical protein U0795_16575 [Pirellulales bacterium]